MLGPIQVKPGVNTQMTPTLAGLQWSTCNLIRFREGLLEKLGGWVKTVSNSFQGVCRGMHSWTQLNGFIDMGIGTNLKLFMFQGGQFFDLTPIRASGTLANNPFTTVLGSNVVSVASTSHNLAVGDFVELSGATTFNNVTMNGEFQVNTIIDANNYTLIATSTASASGVGGGAAVAFQYLLPVGPVDTTFQAGFGTGGFGLGPFGEGSASNFLIPARTWSIDNWGEFMVANPRNGGIYQWMPASGTNTRATTLTNSPLFNSGIMVGSSQQQLISWGAETGGTQDLMLLRWTDVGDNTDWVASPTNQAGSFRLSRGSRIMSVMGSSLVNLIWTNEGLWTMQYIGQPFIYGFTQVGFSCGLIAPKAAASTSKGVFWMDIGANFFAYNGTVMPLDCPVRDVIAKNLNTQQLDKIFTAQNSEFNEVSWFYASAGSTEIDSYVKYNYAENLWDFGSLPRTAWEDHENFSTPMATDPNGFLYNHESGVDADNSPMDSFAQTGYAMDSDGDWFMFLERLVPDFATFVGSLNASIIAVNYPNEVKSDDPITYGPLPIVAGVTPFQIFRARGRGLAIRIESNSLGGNFRVGLNRVRMSRAGRR